MKNLHIRRAGIAAFKCGFAAFGLLAVWILLNIDNSSAPWYVYVMAIFGSVAAGILLLGIAIEAEDELDREEKRRQAVPVPKIERHK